MLRRYTLSALSLLVAASILAACGQQGPDGPKPKPPPPRPDGAGNATLSAGFDHNLMLREDGAVVAWGRNDGGQLGNGTTEPGTTATVVSGLSDVVSVHAGGYNSFALRSDGTVWAWGSNLFDTLGTGVSGNHLTPVQVMGVSDIVHLSSSGSHTLAVDGDGTVWGWGSNSYGVLGDGTTEFRASPVKVPGLTGIVQVVAGTNYFSLALKDDGTVYMWGRHPAFVTGGDASVPTQVPGVERIVDLAAGGYIISNVDTIYVAARDEDGNVWFWTRGAFVRQEDGSHVFTPTLISGLEGVLDATVSMTGHFLALVDDGTVWSWGSGWLGYGEGHTYSPTPTQVASLSNITSIAVGQYHAVVSDDEGGLWAWGQNGQGQLGDGTTETRNEPVAVAAVTSAP